MTKKKYIYRPKPFTAILLYLLASRDALTFNSSDYKGNSNEITALLSKTKHYYKFTSESRKHKYGLMIYNSKLKEAQEYTRAYCTALVKNKIKDDNINQPSWKTMSDAFYNSIQQDKNLREYKLSTIEHVPVILYEYIENRIQIKDINLELHHDSNDSISHILSFENEFDNAGAFNEDCILCNMTLDLTNYINHYNGIKILEDKNYSPAQKQVLNRIKELVSMNIFRLSSNIIEEIFDMTGDNREVSHKVSECVRKLNKRYSEINGRKILGKKQYEHYPILIK